MRLRLRYTFRAIVALALLVQITAAITSNRRDWWDRNPQPLTRFGRQFFMEADVVVLRQIGLGDGGTVEILNSAVISRESREMRSLAHSFAVLSHVEYMVPATSEYVRVVAKSGTKTIAFCVADDVVIFGDPSWCASARISSDFAEKVRQFAATEAANKHL